MKVQTAVLLLCFLSGVFLSVVQAKPSPALMRELVALEKYLEKKEGSEGTDGQSGNQGEKPSIQEPQNIGQKEEINDKQDKPNNENNNNEERNTEEGSDLDAGNINEKGQEVQSMNPMYAQSQNVEDSGPSENGEEAPNNPTNNRQDKSENENNNDGKTAEGSTNPEDAPPKNAEGSVPSQPYEEEESSASGVKGGGNLPPEGNKPNPLEGQVENGRDQIYEILDEVTRKVKDALDKLRTLGEAFRAQFQNDDLKFTELENNSKKAKEKTNEKIGQLKTLLEEINRSTVRLDETTSVGKESVRENAPARRSHISDTEFLNMLHSLLAYS